MTKNQVIMCNKVARFINLNKTDSELDYNDLGLLSCFASLHNYKTRTDIASISLAYNRELQFFHLMQKTYNKLNKTK